MTHVTGHRYVVRDDDIPTGEPIVVGTRTPPVHAIVELWRMALTPIAIPPRLPALTVLHRRAGPCLQAWG
jgi:uncharacterized protein (DUF433 family)